MKIKEVLKWIEERPAQNFFVVAPDALGFQMLLVPTLKKIAALGDVYYYDARALLKDRVREIEREARMAPVGSSNESHFVIRGVQNLNAESVGPLLKVVEEAKTARFIFQAQWEPKKIWTLQSRSVVLRVPFFSEKVVLANLDALKQDAAVVAEQGLYDGTLDGTTQALAMKDSIAEIHRLQEGGMRSLTSLLSTDVVSSLAFKRAVEPSLEEEEIAYLRRGDSLDRKRIVLYLRVRR